jgi:hypothetical protein
MKVVAVKGIEKDSINNLWEVRYTRMRGKHVQDAVFSFRTEEEAKHKYAELLDILINRDGVYIGSKEKRKATARERKPLKREVLHPSCERISGSIATLRACNLLSQEVRQLLVQGLRWSPSRQVTMIRNTHDGSWQLWPGDTTEGKPLMTFTPSTGKDQRKAGAKSLV